MVILNIQLDNLLLFNDYSMNLSYPKKPVNTTIENEHLAGRPNFRYKKLIVLMGANATGKTALGKVVMGIFNFIARRDYSIISALIEDSSKDAFFSVDMASDDCFLYRITTIIKGRKTKHSELKSDDIDVQIKSEYINKRDSYEKCVERLEGKKPQEYSSFVQALESVPFISWKFELRFTDGMTQRLIDPNITDRYAEFLEETLKSLDPRIEKVDKVSSTDSDNTFIIIYKNHSVLIKDGIVMESEKLSSGTADGVGVADLITSIKLKLTNFIYCDEQFSHIHSSAETAFLALMVDVIGDNQQLFFTTHNTDILNMNLPFHSFAFLRRDEFDDNNVSCVYASEYLKKNNMSLKNAVENDLFLAEPNTDPIYSLRELFGRQENEQQ